MTYGGRSEAAEGRASAGASARRALAGFDDRRSGAASGVHQFPHGREEGWQKRNGRKFTLLIDRKLAIVGTRGGDEPTLAMMTEHPAMVELLLNNFCRDVVIHELQQDMGAKLEDKYGKNFKKIIQKYTEA